MPYEVSWYVENRVVLNRIWGEYDLEQMRAGNEVILAWMHPAAAPVHLLVDVREIGHFPRNFRPMLQEIERFRNEANMGWGIMLTTNSLLHFFGVLASNVTRSSFRAASNYEEVNVILGRVDPVLAPLLPLPADFPSTAR
jgi:hypothetical protein